MAFKQEGVTSFAVDKKARSFRFQVSVVDDKLAMWFEDTETKQQWRATALTVPDFVDSQSVIPHAQPPDYAEHFVECLRAEPAAADTTSDRMLSQPEKDGTRKLTLVLFATFTSRTARYEYVFTLFPVALDVVDILAARMRDLEDKIKRMEQSNEALVTLKTLAAEPEAAFQWEICDACQARDFQLQDEGRTIELVRGGRYLISLHLSASGATMHEIEFNGKRDRGLWASIPQNHHQMLSYTAWVAPKTTLRVVNKVRHPPPLGAS